MTEMPLFPLNAVLFPGRPFPLHIFEERYKEMVNHCIKERRPFAIVLIKKGQTQHGPVATPYEIGCATEIVQIENLPEGRMNIMTIGIERVRIRALKRDRPYLVGEVESIPFAEEPEHLLQQIATKLHPLVIQYLEILADMSNSQFDRAAVPNDPVELANLAAAILQNSNEEKQSLLELDTASALMKALLPMYRSQINLMVHMPKEDEKSPFFLN